MIKNDTGIEQRCVDCGTPRSVGSTAKCRPCYEHKDPKVERSHNVTRYNYREVARSFSEDQLRKLAALMKRHDSKACWECRHKRICQIALEAVEAVALDALPTEDAPDYYPATDWNQNSYAAFEAAL
jgi:hypothetical protein